MVESFELYFGSLGIVGFFASNWVYLAHFRSSTAEDIFTSLLFLSLFIRELTMNIFRKAGSHGKDSYNINPREKNIWLSLGSNPGEQTPQADALSIAPCPLGRLVWC